MTTAGVWEVILRRVPQSEQLNATQKDRNRRNEVAIQRRASLYDGIQLPGTITK